MFMYSLLYLPLYRCLDLALGQDKAAQQQPKPNHLSRQSPSKLGAKRLWSHFKISWIKDHIT